MVFILSIFLSFHNFHVTHTTLHYDHIKESIEITIKVAVDDLEQALEDQGINRLHIASDNEVKIADELIKQYFNQKLKISPNNYPADLDWVGKELSENLHDLYLYFEIIKCNQNGEITSLFLENTIFTELQPDQANIVLIEFGVMNHNLIFSSSKNSQHLKLEN